MPTLEPLDHSGKSTTHYVCCVHTKECCGCFPKEDCDFGNVPSQKEEKCPHCARKKCICTPEMCKKWCSCDCHIPPTAQRTGDFGRVEKGWEERFNAIVNDWKEPDFEFERVDELTSYMSKLIKKLKALLFQVETEAYERGKAEGSRGDYGRKMYQNGVQAGKQEALEMIAKGQGWEETQKFYEEKLGITIKFKK